VDVGGSTAPEASLKTDKRHYLAKAAAGEKKAAEGGKGAAAPPRKESGNDKVVRKKRGLEQYKVEKYTHKYIRIHIYNIKPAY
jgi:hypothetical protein